MNKTIELCLIVMATSSIISAGAILGIAAIIASRL